MRVFAAALATAFLMTESPVEAIRLNSMAQTEWGLPKSIKIPTSIQSAIDEKTEEAIDQVDAIKEAAEHEKEEALEKVEEASTELESAKQEAETELEAESAKIDAEV